MARGVGEVRTTIILALLAFFCCFSNHSFHQSDSFWRKSHIERGFKDVFYEVRSASLHALY